MDAPGARVRRDSGDERSERRTAALGDAGAAPRKGCRVAHRPVVLHLLCDQIDTARSRSCPRQGIVEERTLTVLPRKPVARAGFRCSARRTRLLLWTAPSRRFVSPGVIAAQRPNRFPLTTPRVPPRMFPPLRQLAAARATRVVHPRQNACAGAWRPTRSPAAKKPHAPPTPAKGSVLFHTAPDCTRAYCGHTRLERQRAT